MPAFLPQSAHLEGYYAFTGGYASSSFMQEWEEFRTQLLQQWSDITREELDKAGPDRHNIALLIEHKYGVSSQLVELYLRNFEHTMPLAANDR